MKWVSQLFFRRNAKYENRRRRQRKWLNTSVRVLTGAIHVDALGINFSDVGMCLFAMANLPLGSRIQVEFLHPSSTERVSLGGTVRHRALYLYGIEFLPEPEHGR
jgi:hypothetical protein